METAFKKDIYEQLSLVWSGTASRELTGECVVPDTMPDVATVVDADGVLILRSKETETGTVCLTAAVNLWVLYQPEDGGVMRSLEMTVPAEIRMDASAVDGDCRTVANLRLRGLDARAIHSRKVAVRCDVEAEVQCFGRSSLEIASGLEDGQSSIHLLTKTAGVATVADVREKTFVVTDEYPLPPGCGGVESILSQRVEASVEDVKYVSGKAVFRGRVRVGLLFAAAEGGRLVSGRYETEFSQIMELDSAGEEALPTVSLLLTGVYFDLPRPGENNDRVSAELHMAAQAICRQKQSVTYIADLYSNKTVLVPACETLTVVEDMRPVSLRQTVAGRAEPFSGQGEVLRLAASVGAVTAQGNTVKTTVNIRLLSGSAQEGYTLSRCRLAAEFTATDLPENGVLRPVSVTATDVYYAPGSGSADVRVTLQLEALAVLEKTVEYVQSVSEDAQAWEQQRHMPSITMMRVPPQTDLWQLAKRYHSTLEAIETANEGRRDGLLLLPKGQ
jgi:hypothetical protein